MENLNQAKCIFNSPIEIALRLLFILNKTSRPLDLQRLIYYNYLIVHSSDIPEAPKSIHADLPRRSGEILLNRAIFKRSLNLLILKDMITVKYSSNGILFFRNDKTEQFISYFQTSYSRELDARASWLSEKFDRLNDEDLEVLMKTNVGKWGSEFSVINDYSEGN
jgi:hypothetical protein